MGQSTQQQATLTHPAYYTQVSTEPILETIAQAASTSRDHYYLENDPLPRSSIPLTFQRRFQRTRPRSTTPPCPTVLPLPRSSALRGQLLTRQAQEEDNDDVADVDVDDDDDNSDGFDDHH